MLAGWVHPAKEVASTNLNGAVNPTQGGRGWRPTSHCHTPIRRLR